MRSFRRRLIGALVLAVVTAGCSGRTTGHAFSRTTTAIHGTLTAATVPAVTTAQLNAHLGAGVPSGWSPVDDGAARVFVPRDWILESKGSCISDAAAAGMISIGSLPNTSCDQRGQFALPRQAVALVSSSQRHTGRPALTVHGYHVYKIDSHTPGWVLFDVPQLGIRIATHGSTGSRILNTLAPSARKIALDSTYQTVPSNWHAGTEDGVPLSIPPSWSIVTPTYLCGAPVGDSELLLITPKVPYAPCAYVIPKAADAAHDDAALYLTPHNPKAPRPTGQSITTLQHGTTTITIYAERTDPNALDLFVHKAGSKITHVLTLGLGRDGRTAAGVLASIRAVS